MPSRFVRLDYSEANRAVTEIPGAGPLTLTVSCHFYEASPSGFSEEIVLNERAQAVLASLGNTGGLILTSHIH